MSAEMGGNQSSESLFEELRAVVRDAEALLRATSAQSGEKLQEARARAEESLRAAKARMSDLQESTLRQARAATDATENYVRENPWQALGIAAGVGVLIGLLVSRR
jgi:ElaB/YqjD/DUF883 family membrane-anchored ribosome-binding protein